MRLKSYLNEAGNATLKTRLQEGLACVAFGIYQLKRGRLSVEDLRDSELFSKAHTAYAVTDSSVQELWDFSENNPDYRKSVVISAHALFSSGYTKGEYKFYRGRGFMDTVYKEFDRLAAQEGIKIGKDKWNPGDVWISKVPTISGRFNSLVEYNAYIAENLEKGNFMGVSLKKVTGSASVHHQKPSGGTVDIGFKSIVAPKQGMFSTGMNIETTQSGLFINFRSFRISHQADITGELIMKGTSARHGKVPSSLLHGIINQYGIPQSPRNAIEKEINSGNIEHLKEYVLKLWGECGHRFSKSQMESDWKLRVNKIQDNFGYWQSIIHALELGAWLTKNGNADSVVARFFTGAASTDTISSEHLKIY